MNEQTVSGCRAERTHKHTDIHNIHTMETKQDNAPFMCFHILSLLWIKQLHGEFVYKLLLGEYMTLSYTLWTMRN